MLPRATHARASYAADHGPEAATTDGDRRASATRVTPNLQVCSRDPRNNPQRCSLFHLSSEDAT